MNKYIAIIGAQQGDESKARCTHDWSPQFDYVGRYSGGSNCGGMIYRNGKQYVHHQLPAVDYTKSQAKSFLAAGMVINLPYLLEEIQTMQKDFPDVGKNVIVDPDAFIVLPEHIAQDKIEGVKQGTTYQGIKQAYTAKVARVGVRVYHLINDKAPIIQALLNEGVQFIPLLAMREKFEKSSILFEGNQGVMLDLQNGLYPYITSSDCTVSGIYSAGFHFIKLDECYGIAKGGYITRSGGCALPTEMPDEEAKVFVNKGNERGNTTGRDRGIGYFDAVALKYACLKGGITKLVLTKLDIMNGDPTIKVCHSYGKEVYSPNDFKDVVPQYTHIQGWKDAKDPQQIKPFIDFVEKQTGITVSHISAGINSEDLMEWRGQ